MKINSQANIEDLIILFLREFSDKWQTWYLVDIVGFVHGVMNTDNFNITGETFDLSLEIPEMGFKFCCSIL